MNLSNDQTLAITCSTHGPGVGAVVCGHMVSDGGTVVGFVENSSDPNDLQAWCNECEALFLREGEMTEEFRQFTKMSIVCVVCYSTLKLQHTLFRGDGDA